MTDVSLIQMAAPRLGAATYVAVPSRHVLDVLALAGSIFAEAVAGEFGYRPDDLHVERLPWATLPGAWWPAAVAYDADPGRWPPVLFLGTVTDGEWQSWYLPGTPPPPPAVRKAGP